MSTVKLEMRIGFQGTLVLWIAVFLKRFFYVEFEPEQVSEAVLNHMQYRVNGGRWKSVKSIKRGDT